MSSPAVMPVTSPEERSAALAAAVDALRAGEPVGVPTDTVYGLAADAADAGAVKRLFELKERPYDRSIAVLVADVDGAAALVELTERARRLAERFWPGPLTIVAARTSAAPPHLGTGTTIGVRLPDDDVVRSLAASGPLAVTSANLHAAPTPATAQGVADLFPTLGLVIDGGSRPGASSTVVDMTGSTPAVLREGPVSLDEIMTATSGPGF